jgi:hypothetical protein
VSRSFAPATIVIVEVCVKAAIVSSVEIATDWIPAIIAVFTEEIAGRASNIAKQMIARIRFAPTVRLRISRAAEHVRKNYALIVVDNATTIMKITVSNTVTLVTLDTEEVVRQCRCAATASANVMLVTTA